jgi:hypothetical protein
MTDLPHLLIPPGARLDVADLTHDMIMDTVRRMLARGHVNDAAVLAALWRTAYVLEDNLDSALRFLRTRDVPAALVIDGQDMGRAARRLIKSSLAMPSEV